MAIPAVFADFLLSTDSSYVNGAQDVLEGVTYNTFAWKRLLSGKDPKDVLQGGASIKSFIQLDDANSAHFYSIGEEETPSQPQTVTSWEVPWRFLRSPMTWDDETVKLNTSGMGRTARHKEYFNFKRQIEKACWIDKYKLMERALGSTPDSTMSSTTSGKVPQGLFGYLINEFANTLPTGITSIQGIDPSSKTNWANQIAQYTGGSLNFTTGITAAAAEVLLATLSKMARKVRFDGLPARPEFQDRSSMPSVVWTTLGGLLTVETCMRALQDSFVYMGRQDPTYPNPTIMGVPIEYVDALADSTIFDDGSSGFATETTADIIGPRYFFCNLQDITPVFHEEMFMKKHPPLTPYRQPSRHTIYVDTYYNLVCHNRRTQGIVGPITSDATGYATFAA